VRNFGLRVSLLFCLAVTMAGQADEWKTYRNTDGNFRVLFPGDPKDTVNPAGEGIQSHTLLAIQKPAVYTVVYATMQNDQPVNDATYVVYRDGVFKELPKCTVAKDGPAAPSIQGYIAHWYRLNCEGVNMIGNLYWGKRHAYAVLTMFPSGAAEPAATGKFSNSFGVLTAE
jgi:hypothetical protein